MLVSVTVDINELFHIIQEVYGVRGTPDGATVFDEFVTPDEERDLQYDSSITFGFRDVTSTKKGS